MKPSIVILILIVFLTGCDCNDSTATDCYQGHVIDHNCCNGLTTISLSRSVAGSQDLTINGINYKNVIRVPNPPRVDENAHVYINIRPYHEETDRDMVVAICMCAISMDQVASHVVTASSTLECP